MKERENRVWQALKLYIHYISINIRSMMEYKTSFFLMTVSQFLVSFNVFLGVFFMFQRFSNVKGFTYSEVLLCFSIMLLEFSLAEMYARGFDVFPGMIKNGTFDRVLVRPQSEILQVLGSKFELTRIGRMLQSVVMFIYGITKSEITWTPYNFYVDWWNCFVYRYLSYLCCSLFLHYRWAGVYEHPNRRSQRIW